MSWHRLLRVRTIVFLAVFVGLLPAAAYAVSARHSSQPDFALGTPSGPATLRAGAATETFLACAFAHGAKKIPGPTSSAFAVEGIDQARRACKDEDTAMKAALADPVMQSEGKQFYSRADTLWRCLATAGYAIPGFNAPDLADDSTAFAQTSAYQQAFATCRTAAGLDP